MQQDIGHVLVDTDPNQRTRRLANVMEDDPEGEIDPATGSVRQVVKLSAESVAQYAALKKSWADDDAKVKSILTLTTIGEANQVVTNSKAPGGKAALRKLHVRFGSLTVAQQFNHYRKLLQFTGFSSARGARAVERGFPVVCPWTVTRRCVPRVESIARHMRQTLHQEKGKQKAPTPRLRPVPPARRESSRGRWSTGQVVLPSMCPRAVISAPLPGKPLLQTICQTRGVADAVAQDVNNTESSARGVREQLNAGSPSCVL